MEYKFNELFPKSYEVLGSLIEKYCEDGKNILDVGTGDGASLDLIDSKLESSIVTCVEPNKSAFEKLENKRLNQTKSNNINLGFRDFSIQNSQKFDYTIFQRSLHHIDVGMDFLLDYLGGTLIIVDPFYSQNITDEHYSIVQKILDEKTNHTHTRNEYCDPLKMMNFARQHKFQVRDFQEHRNRLSRFYSLVLTQEISN